MATFYQPHRTDDLQPWHSVYGHRYVLVHRGSRYLPRVSFLLVSQPVVDEWPLGEVHDALQFEVHTPSDIMNLVHQIDRLNVLAGWEGS